MLSTSGSAANTVGKYNSLRYRGYYYDSETGYYYLQSRYYDPSYRRFINADEPKLITELTKESVFGGNLFVYCENNACNTLDITGYGRTFDFWQFVNSYPFVKLFTRVVGFSWDRNQGIWYSNHYAIQHAFGYCDLYDALAPLVGIFIKHKKIEFDYSGKKWMIWIWKGTYVSTTGAEIGVYIYQPGSLIEKTIHQKWYRCANKNEWLKMSFSLYKNEKKLFSRPMQKHWWLTGFKPGMSFSWDKLKMVIKIEFLTMSMAKAFCKKANLKSPKSSTVSFTW